MILSGQTIREEGIVTPHEPRTETTLPCGRTLTHGESFAGYDIRTRETIELRAGYTTLASTIECFVMPLDVLGKVYNKSSWARRGVNVFTTLVEPGWDGFLTTEISYAPLQQESHTLTIKAGCPIAQVVFERIDYKTSGYFGKYAKQPPWPVEAL